MKKEYETQFTNLKVEVGSHAEKVALLTKEAGDSKAKIQALEDLKRESAKALKV